MGLKEIYLQLEDKWYNSLDKIDAYIPIYRVVDKIDAVVPSFALFVAIIICLAFALVATSLALGQQATVTIAVEDSQGNLLQGIEVDYAIAGVVNSSLTNENGEISIAIPFNSSLEVKVAASELFEGWEETFFIETEPTFSGKIVLRKKSPAFVDRTILFQNSSGERIEGKAIRVRLSCQNPLVTPSPLEVVDLDMDGSITVKEPKDCGIFQATVIEPAEFRQKSYILNRETQTIRLEAKDVAKGSLRVKIKDSAGNIVVSSNFDVTLLDMDGIKVDEKYSQNYGEVLFSGITDGTYSVSVEDPLGEYAIASQPGISVSADEITAIDIIVSKTVKATLNVSVVDKETGNAIPNATVRVINAERETVSEKNTGEEAEQLVFRLTDQGDYTLFAMHSDYLYEVLELLDAGSEDIRIELERITELNSGRVEVRVIDEDGLPVKNARVKLRFLETGMLVPIQPEMTDRNGVARFRGVKEGAYYAYVEKFPAFGDNMEEGKELEIREVTRFTVRLIIGNSLVKVGAFDEDLLPVHEAEAEFFSLQGESLGKIPLTDGTGQFNLKADKKAYAVVSHPGYMPVQTMPEQLWPDKAIEFSALMEPRLILGTPLIEFEGVFDMAGSQVQQLDAGNRYLAKFKLSIPEEGNYEMGGFHFMVGDERLLVNDPMVVKEAVAGSIIAPLKGTTYTPPLGYEEDSENVTEGDAKWINIMWNDLEPMNYYFGFEIRVKSQITPYTRLSMHYRAWAIDGSGDYIRTPLDSELGFAESVASKQSLYANTLNLGFLEGQAAECQQDFCYSGESILDEDKGLYIYEPYQMRAGSPHNFTFSILNNSLREYDDSSLYITVDGLTIDSYSVQNASAAEISAENIAVEEIEGIDLGEFTKGKSINGKVHFTPATLGNASIEIKVIADARQVFLKTIPAQVMSEKSMEITVLPEVIPSFVPNRIEVSVKEVFEEQGFELGNVLVRVSITNPDKTQQFYSGMTNSVGIAIFNLPPADPGTKIKIEAEKPGYYAEPVILFVDSDILLFSPDKVEASLDTRGTRERILIVGIENLIGENLTIEEVELTGRFGGLLDEMTMLNFTKQYIGTTIPANSIETLQLFKVVLGKNAKELLLRSEELSGEYHITVSNRETGIEWDFIIPLEVEIRIGGLPDNSPCLSISQKEWVTATQGNRATVEFEIRNNCMSGNRFVDLDNLQAKLAWTGDVIGVVELSITEAATGASNTAVLRSLVWTPMFDAVRAESVYYAILTFTPKAGHLGERAVFDVMIDGEIMTDSGPVFVGSSPGSIKSGVDVINLEQCIQYPDAENVVEIREAMDFATFVMDSSQCGETTLEIELCYRDAGCSGGALEGDLGVMPDGFKLTPNIPTKEIRVERRGIPGMYGVTVFARIPGSSYRQVHVVDVLVRPERDEAFYLDKYAFTILGRDSKDSTILVNTQLEEQVNVRASVCAWGEASEKGNFDAGMALAGAGVGFAIGVTATAGTFATIGPAFMGLAFCPPCLVIMAVLAVIGGLLGGMFGDDPCDESMTQALPDWVINLRDDAEGVSMDNPMISAEWNVESPKVLGANEEQQVGIWFENLGIEEIKPTYSTATVTAKKHHHAQPTNYGKSSNFGTYMVKDREVTTYVQKFHLKFDTKIVPQEIPPISLDAYECVQGTLIGRAGPGALPKTALNWNWDDATGITMGACDYGNEDFIYCDATQFSIEVSKRIHMFDEFLEINRENLVCPASPMERYLEEFENQYSTREVESGSIGLRKVTNDISGDALEINFEVENDTASTQTATVTVQLTVPDSVSIPEENKLCVREFDVAAQQIKKGKCSFSGLVPSNEYYGISVDIDSSTSLFVDTNGFIGSFRISEPAEESECWIPQSTGLLDGKPAIEYFFEEAENIVWTPEIPNIDALRDLLYFKAYLMKDGYSEDFQKDFADYSITKDFFNAPAWFSDDQSGKIADYFADPFYLEFTRRYVDSDQLPNAGLYDVLLDIEFIGDDWDMFDAYGQPNAKIKVEFYFLRAAYPNSLFYYLPFNGNIGVDSENGRQGYGVNYENATDELLIMGGGEMVKTGNIAGSSPSMNLKTDMLTDFKKVNSTASNRGFLLSIEEGEEFGQKRMDFYPNYATPVILKMSHEESEQPFSAFFELRADGTPLETGSNLTFWDGAGRCLDFIGVPVVEAFDFKPDREADAKDLWENWQFAYAVDWSKADYGGDVYLKTIFYTPINKLYSLRTIEPEKLQFITPNSIASKIVELNGIAGMAHNSELAQSRVSTVRELFELTAAGDVCVTNSGTKTSFWWNPKSMYERAGHNTSVKELEQSLVAGENCIGYGS